MLLSVCPLHWLEDGTLFRERNRAVVAEDFLHSAWGAFDQLESYLTPETHSFPSPDRYSSGSADFFPGFVCLIH